MGNKEYVGDGVYAEWNGYAITLTTENGITISNRIVLEPEVIHSLIHYVERMK